MRKRSTILSLFFIATACGGGEFNDSPADHSASGTGGAGGSEATGGASGTTEGSSGVGGDSGSGASAGFGGGGDAGMGGDAGSALGGAGGEGPDAGEDASLTDAESEVSLPDSSLPDSSLPDAPPPDAPPPDADPSCPVGYGDCDGQPGNGCETQTTSNVSHCGACDYLCAKPANASPTCVASVCGFLCSTGYEDCDNNAANGCEADLSSVQHCLGCGNVCPAVVHATPTCVASGCSFECETSWGNCDSNPTNGCEANLTSTVGHCGACHNACTVRPNSDPTCVSSQCGFSCHTGYRDCDGSVGNGCEINVTNHVGHCGACNAACGTANGTPSCNGSVCSIACNSGWGDCDTINGNGCETNVTNNLNHCGGCGVLCGSANGNPSCASGTCSIACHTNYANCDGVNANGCEANLMTDGKNCGVCGRDCLGATCVNGYCTPQLITTGTSFRINDTALYYTTDNALRSIVPGSIYSFTLASSLLYPIDPFPTSTRVYYGVQVNAASGKIESVVLSGVPVLSRIAEAGPVPRSIQVVDGKLWWLSTGDIWSAPPNGTREQVTGAQTNELVAGNGYLYWASASLNIIARVRTTTGVVTTLASSQSQPSDVAVGGTNNGFLFWTNRGNGTIRRSTLTGASPINLVTGQTSPASVAASADHVYWTTPTGVFRASTGGDETRQIATGQSTPTDVAVHDNHVYWRNASDNKIWRIAK